MVPRALRRSLRHARRGSRAPLARESTRQPQQRAADTHRFVRDERELTRAMRY
jgi:hypothetical protein